MLALKLLLVPGFLLLVSIAGRKWGPSMAGWLAGLPVVAGPILFFLAVEHGEAFAAHAATAALSAVFASVSFSLAYAHAAQRAAWPISLLAGLGAWTGAAFGLSLVPASPDLALALAVLTLHIAPRLFPGAAALPAARTSTNTELALRMLAGAMLTVAVTLAAARLGHSWSGLFAVFPVLAIVLAVFSHRTQGPAHVVAMLRAMATGLYSFVAFCLCLAVALPLLGIEPAFLASTGAALAIQALTRRRLALPADTLPMARTP